MRTSSRMAFAISWMVFLTTVVLAWRKVTAVQGGDVTGLIAAAACGACGLALLVVWLQDHERR